MRQYLWIGFVAFLCTGAFAQPKKIPLKALQGTSAMSPAIQAAMRHVEAARLAALQKQFQASKQLVPNVKSRKIRNYSGDPKKTSQQWLDELEQFIQINNRFPVMAVESEKKLLIGVSSTAIRLGPHDPITKRIRELRAQYPRKPRGNPPAFWLEKLEVFVQEKGFFPKPTSATEEEKKLYLALQALLHRLPAHDPVAQRVRELEKIYKQPAQHP